MLYVKMFFCLVLLFAVSELSQSQTLKFCEKVDSKGNGINVKTLFTIDKSKGGNIKCLVKLPFSVGTEKVTFEIYSVEKSGAETYKRNVTLEVSPDKMWFWKEVKFTQEGSYNVKVYDGQGNHLVTSHLTIQYN